jgi:O-antigen/teichoic acid export membrane protein
MWRTPMTPELTYPEPAARTRQAPSVNRGFLIGVARGAAFALIIQLLGAGLGYLSQVAFARWMGLAQFGRYTYLMAWATILALLAGLGFPMSVLRFIPEYRTLGDHARLRGVVRMSRGASLGAGLGMAGVGLILALAFAPGKSVTAIALAAWLIPVGALINVDLAVIRAGGRVVGAYAPSLVVRPVLILLAAGVVWLTWKRLTASTALLITLGAFALVALLQSRLVSEVVRRGRQPRVALYDRRRWLRVSAPLLLVAGFQIALSQTDLLVVGTVRGVQDAGLYSAAAKTATLVGYLLVALNAVTAPLFAELEAKGDRAGLQRLATVSALWVFWPTFAIAGGLALLAPFVLGLFGPGFVVAKWALIILLGGQLVSAGCGAVGYLMSMTGHQNDTAWVYGVVSILNVPVCYAGVRAFGLDGAAAATSVSLIAWNVWLHQLTKKRIGVRASIVSALLMQRATRGGGGDE